MKGKCLEVRVVFPLNVLNNKARLVTLAKKSKSTLCWLFTTWSFMRDAIIRRTNFGCSSDNCISHETSSCEQRNGVSFFLLVWKESAVIPSCYYYLRVLYFANFCDFEKIAKLSTRKNFYQHIRHSDVYTIKNMRDTSSSKSTRSPAAYCFSNDVSVWVAPAFIKSKYIFFTLEHA